MMGALRKSLAKKSVDTKHDESSSLSSSSEDNDDDDDELEKWKQSKPERVKNDNAGIFLTISILYKKDQFYMVDNKDTFCN